MRTIITLIATAGLLALAGSAMAAPGGGAAVVKETNCVETPFVTTCVTVDTVTRFTTAASGTTSYVTNGSVTIEQTFPFGGSYTSTESLHARVLQKDGEIHVAGDRYEQVTHYESGTYTSDCVISFASQYANGAVQFGDYQVDCG